MKNLKLLGLLGLALAAVTACGPTGGDQPDNPNPPTPPVDTDKVDLENFDLEGSTKKVLLTTIGGSGLSTAEGFFEDEFELTKVSSAAAAVAGEKFYSVNKVDDWAAIANPSEFVVFVHVEFTGKGAVTIGDAKAQAQNLVANAQQFAGIVLVGLDGVKNRGASTDELWTTLMPVADKIVVSEVVANGNFFASVASKTVVVGGTSTNLYNGLANEVWHAYTEFAK